MNTKYVKYIFIFTIIILIISGIYIIYIKDIDKKEKRNISTKEQQISKEITIRINITQEFDTKPGLAEECSKIDELTYIVRLDENKKWDNGENVKFEDIEFSIETINQTNSIYKENINNIEKIEKVDEKIFKIYLKRKVNFFEYLLCFPIVQKSTYNEQIPQGIGEYEITKIDEEEITIENENTKLIIKKYKNATELYNEFSRENIDLIITQNVNYDEYIGNIGFGENIITGREFYYISTENIEDKNIRKLLNENISKEKLVYDLYNKRYIVVDYPLEYGSFLNKKQNMEKNNNQKININKEITLSTSNQNIEIAEAIRENLKEKNIQVRIINYETENADLVLKKQIVPITPEISIYYKNEETKREIEEIEQIENKENLKAQYEKIIQNYYEEVPFISLYMNSYIILHSDKLKGDFTGNWYNMFYNINTWYKIM